MHSVLFMFICFQSVDYSEPRDLAGDIPLTELKKIEKAEEQVLAITYCL